jgi:PKD repeat protein
MGLHQLLYNMSVVSGSQRQPQNEGNEGPADGMEGFDIGPATLDRVTMDQPSYASASDPARAILEIYSHSGGSAQANITLDAGPETIQVVVLDPGYQTISVTLSGPIPAGDRALTTTLVMDGYWSARNTSFVFGSDLPDLTPGAPALSEGDVNVMVSNVGQGESIATTLDLWRDGGLFLGQSEVPALLPGQITVISIPWDTMGHGGDRILSAIVDPAGIVDEYDEANNTSEQALSLQRLELETYLDDQIFLVGETVTVTTQLTNRSDASFGIVLTTTIFSPDGLVAFRYERPLSLTPGGNEELVIWPSIGNQTGLYSLHQETLDDFGQTQNSYIPFELSLSAPQAGFSHNTPVTLGGTSIFTNTTAGGGTIEYQWNFGDGSSIVSGTNPTHLYSAVDSYTVVLTATNEGGSDVYSDQHVVLPPAPSAGFTSNSLVVVGSLSVFTNTTTGGGAIDYLWNFGDGTPVSSDINPTHLYSVVDSYTVILTATNDGGASVVSDLHLVVPVAPSAGFTSNSPVVLGSSSHFTNTTTGGGTLTYQWNFDDGSPLSTETNPSHIYSAVDSYTVILTATNDGGVDVFSALHEIVETSDFAVYLPILLNSFSPDNTRAQALGVGQQSCETKPNQLVALFAGLMGDIGLGPPQTGGCSAGIVGLSGLSLPWLLLLGMTFVYRRRKRS